MKRNQWKNGKKRMRATNVAMTPRIMNDAAASRRIVTGVCVTVVSVCVCVYDRDKDTADRSGNLSRNVQQNL